MLTLPHFSEKSLAALNLARRNKVEEIKKKTNYYETRELLERYEDGPFPGAPASPNSGLSSRPQPQHLPMTPQRAAPRVPPNTPANLGTPTAPDLQSQFERTYHE
jgi:endoplasmic reticulum junction formation protein lunapark